MSRFFHLVAEILTFFAGLFVAGFRVGALEGAKVGLPVDVGDFVGLLLASFGVGAFEGTAVGLSVTGLDVGWDEGRKEASAIS